MKTWLITGASTGLGRAIAEEALQRGDRVVLTARNPRTLDDLASLNPQTSLPLPLDVTDQAEVTRAVERAREWAGGIDVLVNNAGYGLHGAIEEVSQEETADVFDVNVFGLLRVTRAVLPLMRRQGRGHVINIGSVAGLAGNEGTGIYSATKFAVEGISESLRAEVVPLGIQVTVVEPGPFRTEFNGRSIKVAAVTLPAYAETAGRRTAALRQSSGKQAGDPRKAARIINDIACSQKPPLHLLLGNVALKRLEPKLSALHEELARWESVSRSADYDAA